MSTSQETVISDEILRERLDFGIKAILSSPYAAPRGPIAFNPTHDNFTLNYSDEDNYFLGSSRPTMMFDKKSQSWLLRVLGSAERISQAKWNNVEGILSLAKLMVEPEQCATVIALTSPEEARQIAQTREARVKAHAQFESMRAYAFDPAHLSEPVRQLQDTATSDSGRIFRFDEVIQQSYRNEKLTVGLYISYAWRVGSNPLSFNAESRILRTFIGDIVSLGYHIEERVNTTERGLHLSRMIISKDGTLSQYFDQILRKVDKVFPPEPRIWSSASRIRRSN